MSPFVLSFQASLEHHLQELEYLDSVNLSSVRVLTSQSQNSAMPSSQPAVVPATPALSISGSNEASSSISSSSSIDISVGNKTSSATIPASTSASSVVATLEPALVIPQDTYSHALLPSLYFAAPGASERQFNRFNESNGLIRVVLCKRLRIVYKEVLDRLENKARRPIHLHGPAGLGKSFILFGVACTLLQDHRRFKAGNSEVLDVHVAYIRDAGWFATEVEFFGCFLRALCIAYYDQANVLKILLPLRNLPFDKAASQLLVQDTLLDHSDILGNLVIIVDQLNAIPESVRGVWNRMCSKLRSIKTVCILTSSSANNLESDIIYTSFPIHLRFNENEALAMLDSYDIKISRSDSQFETKMGAIKHATGYNPLELRLLAETNISDFWQRLEEFTNNRLTVMSENHHKFVTEMRNTHRKKYFSHYKQSLLAIAFGTRIDGNITFDRQLVVESDSPNEMAEMVPCELNRYLIPISGLARQVMIDNIHFNSTSTSTFLKSLSDDDGSLLGKVVERYLVQVLSSSRSGTFTWPLKSSNVVESIITNSWDFYRFYGNWTPEGQVQFYRDRTCIFVPHSTNYPDIDIILYNPSSDIKMFVFQICVSRNLSEHSKCESSFEKGSLLHAWLRYLGLDGEQLPKEKKRQRIGTRSTASILNSERLYKYVWVVRPNSTGLSRNSLVWPIDKLVQENGEFLHALLNFT